MSQRSTNFGKERRVEFGRYLRSLRKRRKLKQKDVAAEFHINLFEMETGERSVGDHILVELADKYRVPLEEILRHKYSPQLPLLDTIMEPTLLTKKLEDYLKQLEEKLDDDEKMELTRYAAFLLLRRHIANQC